MTPKNCPVDTWLPACLPLVHVEIFHIQIDHPAGYLKDKTALTSISMPKNAIATNWVENIPMEVIARSAWLPLNRNSASILLYRIPRFKKKELLLSFF